MNLKVKILIDRFAGIPGLLLFGIFLKLGKVFRRKNNSSAQRITVCKLVGMGSIIQSTHLLLEIKRRHPGSRLAFVSSVSNASLLKNLPLIDEVILIDDHSILRLFSSVRNFVRQSRLNPSSHYINLEVYSYFSCILAGLSRSRLTTGLVKRKGDLRSLVYDRSSVFNTAQPVAFSYLTAWENCNRENENSSLYGFEATLQKERNEINAGSVKPAGDYVVINPNASALRIERRWPAARYSELISRLAFEFPDFTFVLTGGKDEQHYTGSVLERVDEKSRSRVINTAGKLTLEELIGLIHGGRLMITNDSGPMHIAFALRKRTLALFGPGHPVQQGVFDGETVIYKKVQCSPCVHTHLTPPCGGNNICMLDISTDEVFQSAVAILRQS